MSEPELPNAPRRDSTGRPFKIHFSWDGLSEWRAKHDIGDKLNEARYFLSRVEMCSDLNEFRWLTSACLSACQASVDSLAHAIRHAVEDPSDPESAIGPDPDAEDRLRKYLVALRKGRWRVDAKSVDPLLLEMSRLRKITAHYGPLHIERVPPLEGEFSGPGHDFVFCEHVVPGVHSSNDYEITFGWVEGRRVLPFLREVIEMLSEAEAVANEREED